METIYEKIKTVLVTVGATPVSITQKAHLQRDLGFDSLDLAEMTVYLENAFGLDIPEEEAAQLVTVGHWVQYVQGKLNEAAQPNPFAFFATPA